MKNGVGLVKVMGRYCGFIAMAAALTNNDVDFCLIPELPFELGGDKGVLTRIVDKVRKNGNALVVVAEGAEEAMVNPGETITENKTTDASGNTAFDDIGEALEKMIPEYAKKLYQVDINVVYIDPTYAIRSVASNATDTLLCTKLAQDSAHAAMYGFTGFSVGTIRNSNCLIPIQTIIEGGCNKVQLSSRQWNRMILMNS